MTAETGGVDEPEPTGKLRHFDPDGEYYALTLGMNRRGRPFWKAQTQWVAWSERNPRWEIREARLLSGAWITQAWSALGQDWIAVHDDVSLAIFYRLGGNALVQKAIAEKRLAKVIAPSECMHDGTIEVGGFGFVGTSHLSHDAVSRRAPSRKLRGQVLKRDNFRCVICGRKATDHIDLELHVHHLVPWRMAGPTAEENLVTLCGTCHKGLNPDFEPSLRELAELPGPANGLDMDNSEFNAEVGRYRQYVREMTERRDQSAHSPQDTR
ncbi:HNH endonuclease [Streptomyces sp. NPDC087440]|uniref:HNH endonuclease n=1 Tax=Streptomyces sp. NPDC087440 TaxID=3365790 RepID=UPI00381AA480